MEIQTQSLRAALDAVKPIVGGGMSALTAPILGAALLTCEGDKTRLAVTNNVDAAIVYIDGVGEAESVAVPFSTLHAIVKKIDSETVRIIPGPERCQVFFGRSRANLPVFDAAEFPSMPECSPQWEKFDREVLRSAIELCCVALPGEREQRLDLQGLSMRTVEGHLEIAASDASRITCQSLGESSLPTMLISKTSAETWASLLKQSGDEPELGHAHGLAALRLGNVYWLTRLIDGTFPDLVPWLAPREEHVITIDAPALLAAMKRVEVFCSDKMRRHVSLDAEAGENLVLTVSGEHGDYTEQMDVTMPAPIHVDLNPAFIAEALAGIEQEVRFAYLSVGPEERHTVRLTTAARPDWMHIIMNIRRPTKDAPVA